MQVVECEVMWPTEMIFSCEGSGLLQDECLRERE